VGAGRLAGLRELKYACAKNFVDVTFAAQDDELIEAFLGFDNKQCAITLPPGRRMKK
jgi:hypothetical protein